MKHIKKMILGILVLIFISSPTVAFEDAKLEQSLNEIKRELKEIKVELRDIRRYLDDVKHENTKWGCYLKDPQAGGVSGTGHTKAEAIGMVLEKCSKQGGACFEHNIKCSSE